MKRFYQALNNLHFKINDNFKLPFLFSFTLLTGYVLIVGFSGYLIGYDLISDNNTSVTDNLSVMFLRMLLIIIFINFNILFLYLLIRWFRHKKLPLRVIYSYYAVFSTLLFLISIMLFISILLSYYALGIRTDHLLLFFGLTIIIILASANLYPAYFLTLALKDEPVDIFWPIILCIVGIHTFTFILFNIWNRIQIIQLWL
ncbi:hypothetical protein [Lacicoccus qingdaonensis]|uniref:Yip1 domain-containing protein n=1 Tax=Lacicoccus qingdaonensis TaxID=576118 RepID=A0A1G9D7B9_9BACL|nr:hypothetical protein [Salinicoccus qingdaonensis]SDK59595.1 hypothetical protein SAMN05216216_10575 [Salinicoccus qingdaonensis]